MKKLIIIVGATTLLSSCGLRFGDYNRYQQVRGNKTMCKVDSEPESYGAGHKKIMKDGYKTEAIVQGGEIVKNWQPYQFTK